ncbi:MAG: hypothetical protein CL912_16825 [Deltaproteobacteria bacterium]|nr:hypothetical protein [Deltaproteobacteria bacterium]
MGVQLTHAAHIVYCSLWNLDIGFSEIHGAKAAPCVFQALQGHMLCEHAERSHEYPLHKVLQASCRRWMLMLL